MAIHRSDSVVTGDPEESPPFEGEANFPGIEPETALLPLESGPELVAALAAHFAGELTAAGATA